jgi:hypothetical protein
MACLPVKIIATTDADGDATATSEASYNSKLYAVGWIVGDYAEGVDAVLSVVNTDTGVEQTLLTLTDADANKVYYPRELVHTNAGVAIDGEIDLPVCVGKLKLVVDDGGNAKTGGVVVYLCA